MKPSTMTGVALCSSLLAGCVAVQNDRLHLGDAASLRAGEIAAPVAVRDWAETSIEGIDRANWVPVEVVVEADATVHPPAYRPHRDLVTRTTRQRGEFPTAESAYELREGSGMDQLRESLLLPVLAAADAIMIIPRMFTQPPQHAVGSPGTEYQRWNPQGPPGIGAEAPMPAKNDDEPS